MITQELPNLCSEPPSVYGLGQIADAAHSERLLAVTGHRISSECDDRNGRRDCIRF